MELQDKILAVLGLIVVIGYGYSMDMVQALQAPLRKQPCNLTSMEINLLYFSTYLPLLLLDIPLGIILDKFPIQKTVLVIGFSSFISEVLIAVLFDFRPEGYLYMVYVLKAVVGAAGSSAFTMQGFIMARYATQNYQMFMGFGLSLPYIFDAINVTISPKIYDSSNSISLPWYIGSFFDFIAVISAILIAILVNRKQRRIKHESLLKSDDGIVDEQQKQEEFKASYLLELPKLFWIIIAAMVVYQMTICIYSNLNDLIINRFSIDYVTTGYLLIIPFFSACPFSLIFGHLIKTRPKSRRLLIVFSPSILTLGLLCLYFLPNNHQTSEVTLLHFFVVVFFLLCLGVMAGTLYTVLSSSVSLLCDKRRLGTAWGVIGMAIGLGETISPIINGLVEQQGDLTQSYTNLTLIYTIITTVAIGMGLWIYLGPFSQIDINFHDSKIRDDEEKERKLRATITTENQEEEETQ